MHNYQVEYTDTFGGDANYSWVRRATVSMPTKLGQYVTQKTYRTQLLRKAKAAVGLTGVRGNVSDYGDTIEPVILVFRPYRSCTVLFVSWSEET